MGTFIIGTVLAGIVCLIIKGMIRKKRNGISGCGGDCGHCSGGCH